MVGQTLGSVKKRRVDRVLLGATVGVLGLGLVMVFSASSFNAEKNHGDEFHFIGRQLLFALAGMSGLFVASRVHYETYKKLAVPLVGLTIIMLAFVFLFGSTLNGATRWLDLGLFMIQPSEFAKLSVVFYLAYAISKRDEEEDGFFAHVLNPMVLPSIVLILILIEPDFGTTLLLISVSFAMLLTGGSRAKHLLRTAIPLGIVIAVLINQTGHAFRRIDDWLLQRDLLMNWIAGEPISYTSIGYHVRQSLVTFGAGGMGGKGLGQCVMKEFHLPEPFTDFIFAIIGNELGVAGVLILFFLVALLAFRGFLIATRMPDAFGMLLGFGLTSLILMQFLINIGVVLAILPCTGISLPFVSYGGSSLLTMLFSVGVLLSLSRSSEPPPKGKRIGV